ncbi:MAG TPA: prolyl oligopeptidase family serine peptidase [Anaeromyxobacteraceae bacterium]|nr:prolyl oligopeptidase family serine peptidase [Anaeromyxobacteraceae bacterium]
MTNRSLLLGLLALGCASAGAPKPAPDLGARLTPARGALEYPPSRRVEASDVLHGVAVTDPYRWLEDAASPEVQAWMTAQDALARAELSRLPERAALADRAKRLYYHEAMKLPVPRGGRVFYERRAADAEKSVLAVRDGAAGRERLLLDPATWSKDGSVSLGGWTPSWDGRRVAYQVRPNNSDEAELRVLDVDTGAVSTVDVVPGAKYAHEVSWTPAGDGFYYTWVPPVGSVPTADRPGFAEVRFHRLGTDPAKDAVVRERTSDPTSFLSATLSRDGRWLAATVSHGWSSTDVWFKDLSRGAQAAWTPLVVGENAIYYAWPYRGTLYVLTNDGAPRWRVMAADPAKPARAAWREVVPEGEATIESFAIVGGKLALSLMDKATSRIALFALDGRKVGDVALPTLGTASTLSGDEEADEAFFTFESFTYPTEVRAVSTATGESRVVFRPELPIEPDRFEVEQVFYPSKDGTKVSMFVVRAKGAKPDGAAPTLLYGYGGFQVPVLPKFSPRVYAWLERGGVYAVPNLRGGNEYGEAWHQGGMLLAKQNTFDDFVGASEWLVGAGWTQPARLAIYGGSNGGLLVGAAMTQRPDLFGAVVCAVPLLDMVRYHLFGSGKTWIAEYGSADDPAQFRALHAYSPYHRVVAGTRYPALLLLSADADDRVDPLHARKFAAAVQAATTGGPVLLRIEKNAGHGGADLRREEVQKTADMFAFLLAEMGVPAQPAPVAQGSSGR